MKEVLMRLGFPVGLAIVAFTASLIWVIISLFQLKDVRKENRMGVMWIPLKPLCIFGGFLLVYFTLLIIFW